MCIAPLRHWYSDTSAAHHWHREGPLCSYHGGAVIGLLYKAGGKSSLRAQKLQRRVVRISCVAQIVSIFCYFFYVCIVFGARWRANSEFVHFVCSHSCYTRQRYRFLASVFFSYSHQKHTQPSYSKFWRQETGANDPCANGSCESERRGEKERLTTYFSLRFLVSAMITEASSPVSCQT